MHDATKVLMGTTQSSDREVSCYASDPSDTPAGLAVRLADDATLSVTEADGELVGVSLGKSLSDTAKTDVCRAGNRVPLQLSGYAYIAHDELTFWTKRNVAVAIAFLDDGATAGAETVAVTGDDDAGYVITLHMDALSTATQCKAALDADEDAAALIDVFITGTAGNTQAAFALDDIDAEPVIGAAVRVSDTTGKAVSAGGTLTGACYSSGTLTGITEDASEVPVAVIDMAGGL